MLHLLNLLAVHPHKKSFRHLDIQLHVVFSQRAIEKLCDVTDEF